jgi:alpha-beta hydrolase superfamily lysophospholipase
VRARTQLKHPDSRDAVPSWDQLAEVSGMAPDTIRQCYKSMLPYFMAVSGGGKVVVLWWHAARARVHTRVCRAQVGAWRPPC